MIAADDLDDQDMLDPALGPVLLNLFTEVAILEHLVRKRFEPKDYYDLTAAQFGLIMLPPYQYVQMYEHQKSLSGLE